MFKKILIIGCGLIGSSILRGSITKKISKPANGRISVAPNIKKARPMIKQVEKRRAKKITLWVP